MGMQQNNVVWHGGHLTRKDREHRLGQQAQTVWFTGLSAAGKSTLAFALEQQLHAAGRAVYVLDGDNLRHGLNSNLGFSAEDRSENIRRVAEVARLMNDAGLIVITAFISPFQADRELARRIIGADHFHEIYVSTPLSICEARDPKGLYKRARAGLVPAFTGVSSPYEAPAAPALTIDTGRTTLPAALEAMQSLLQANSAQTAEGRPA